jgi:hypothetical protein
MKVRTKNNAPTAVKLETLKPGDTFRKADSGPCGGQETDRFILGDYEHTYICFRSGVVWSENPKLLVIPVTMEARDL